MHRIRHMSCHLRVRSHKPLVCAPVTLHHRFLSLTSPGATQDASREQTLPRQASVVICGGGIAGLSAAYQLAKLGVTDVVLLEKGSLTSGTTWHAAGLMCYARKAPLDCELVKISGDLYQKLEEETGMSSGLVKTGSVFLAQTKDRLIELKRRAALARARDLEHALLTPSEVKSIIPWLKTDDLEGALYSNKDIAVDSSNTALSLARAAKNRGVQIAEGVKVEGVMSENGSVSHVKTTLGDIKCDYFINAAGQWARDVGLMSRPIVNIPMHSTAHMYLIMKPLPGLEINKIVVRDPDVGNCLWEWSGGLFCGVFPSVAKPIFFDGIPDGWDYMSLPEDWEHFQPHLDAILHRVPAAANMEVRQLFTGPESFTPDGMCLFGEVAEIRNYYIMAGFNSLGIQFSGGCGLLLAELIVHRRCSLSYWPMDIQRFSPPQNNKSFLRDRITEIEGCQFKIPYPHAQYTSGRKLRCSPLYARLAQAGAVFGQMMGVERPKWFMEKEDTDEFVQEVQRGTFSKPGWFDTVKAEYWSCRESVGVMDMSSYSKFEIKGKSATSLLQQLCPNNIDVPVGTVVHSGMLNERGGYENDYSVARIDKDRYFLICPTIQQIKGYNWISRHLPSDGSVTLRDVTGHYTGLNILGPKARDVLQKLTTTPLSLASFKPFSYKEINLGYATGVQALTITHAGEDGMLMYIPNEFAVHIYDMLMHAGQDYGIRPAGYHALRWLRTEKFFSYWGVDFGSDHTPYEVGREMRVKFDKKVEFIGQSALLKQQKEGVQRRLAVFILEDHKVDSDLWCWGGEPIYRNGQLAGMTTSSGYSAALGSLMCLGWLHNTDQSREVSHEYVIGAKYMIDVAGQMFPAKANLYPPKILDNKQPLFS